MFWKAREKKSNGERFFYSRKPKISSLFFFLFHLIKFWKLDIGGIDIYIYTS
jgi:hypothetical protein